MKLLICTLLMCIAMNAPAQLLKNVKNKIVNKGKSEVAGAKYNAKQKARQAASDELNGFKADFDSTDLDYAILLSDNSGLFGAKGKGEFGAKFLRLAGIARSLYQDADLTDEENARLNLQMGQSGYAMGKFVFAEKRLRAAEGYFQKAGMTSDIGYMKAISGQGLLYTTMGRFKQAELYTTEALQMRKQQLGPDNMSVAASINNFAVLHYNLGQYNEAEKEFEQALSIIRSNQQQSGMAYAIVLNNQAIFNQSIGRYEAAEKNLKEAISLTGQSEITKSRNHLKFFSNLALLYQQMGKYDQAEEIYRGLEKRLEKGKSEYANMLNNVAILLLVMNKHERIEGLLKQAAGIYKTNVGENSPAYAKVISDLGNFYRFKSRYAEAQPLLEKALDIRGQTLGESHPLLVQSGEDLAILHWKKKDYSAAAPLYRKAMDQSLEFINRYFPPMSEAEKTKYWDMLSPRFQRFYNFAVEAGKQDPALLSDMFTYRLATKGLLLSSTRKVNESILASENEDLKNDFNQWIDNKEQLTNLYAYSREELNEQGVNIDSLESATNAMEKRLSEQSREFARYYYTSRVSLTDVQKQLNPGEALVEIIRLRNFDQTFTDSCRYVSFVITKEDPSPSIVVMENGFSMENTYFPAYRRQMIRKVNDEKSFDHFWAPVDEKLQNRKKVYISLDGVYNQINLYTLKKAGGDYLIKQHDFILLGNPKDLVTNERSGTAPAKKAILVGYPDYGKGVLKDLPGTKLEVTNINKLLKTAGYQVDEFLQKNASESNLKAARKMEVLHIATHGYFHQDIQRTTWPVGVHADYARDNVLLRSGLMLSGAAEADNHHLGLENTSNGIMTAYEAMNLDLSGTNLVVLSACETGLGEVKAGEGVYGLQRAFLVAGAKALVMSLWQVSDASTQELMSLFYTKWTKSGDMQKAFKEAQLQLMTKHKEPYHWGAFVMMEE